MNVICFGDSNTYGYDPRGFLGGRYDPSSRWVELLAAKTGWNIQNEGQNGREIPRRATCVPECTDLLIIMLGTNDLLQGCCPSTVADRMEAFLGSLAVDKSKLLLIAPPPMGLGEWVPDRKLIDESIQLTEAYRALAERLVSVLQMPGRGISH